MKGKVRAGGARKRAAQDDEEEGRGVSKTGRVRRDAEASVEEQGRGSSDADGYERGSGARLMITKMELENFKSYAGMRTIGPFHQQFTSIVGPNGSGKSNVIDAILFVFGKRAKQMRQDKLGELIHHSEQYPDLESCRVTVFFQDIVDQPDGFDVVEGSALAVTRVALRSNASRYYLNGRPATFSDVARVLERRGIDLEHNRFLILQGEVEQIAMMKPKAASPHEVGMLEYLEDIIGSNVFHDTIDAASREVDASTERRNEVLARVRYTERERANLSDARDEALLYLRAELALSRASALQLQIESRTTRADAVSAADTAAAAARELESMERGSEDLRDRAAKFAAAHRAEKHGLEKLRRALETVRERWGAYERSELQLREDRERLARKDDGLAQTWKTDAAAVDTARKESATAAQKAAQIRELLQESREALEKKQAALEKLLAGLQGTTAPLHAQLENAQRALMPGRKAVADAEAAESLVRSQIALVRGRAAEAERAKAAAEAELAQLEPVVRELREKEAEATAELARLKERQQQLAAEAVEADKAVQQCSTSVQEMAVLIEEQRSNYAALCNSNAAVLTPSASSTAAKNVNASAALHRPLQVLMEAKRRNRIAGVLHGRVGDLASVDAKYAVAVEMAAGAGLDNVVVDRTATAEQCIGYLRAANAGVARFLPVDELKGLMAQASSLKPAGGYPEGVPRLFDLVNVRDAAVAPALYSILRETLVANDLEQATRIALGGGNPADSANKKKNAPSSTRYRIVTLAGELIERSGAMTGGAVPIRRPGTASSGKIQITGGADSSSSSSSSADGKKSKQQLEAEAEQARKEEERMRKQLEAAEAMLAAQESRLHELRESGLALQGERDAVARRLRALPALISRTHMELESREAQTQTLQTRIANVRAKMCLTADEQREVDALEADAAVRAKAVRAAQTAAAEGEAVVARLQAEIEAAGGAPVQKARKAVQTTSEAVDAISSELSKAEVAQKAADKAAEKAAAKAEKVAQERASLTLEREAAELRYNELQASTAAVLQELESMKSEHETKAAAVAALKSDMDSVESELADLRSREVDVRNRAQTAQVAAKAAEARAAKLEDSLARLDEKFLKLRAEWLEANPSLGPPLPSLDGGVANGKHSSRNSREQPQNENGDNSEDDDENTGDEDSIRPSLGDLAGAAEQDEAYGRMESVRWGEDEVAAARAKEVAAKVAKLQEQVGRMEPNMGAIVQYREKQLQYETQMAELDEVTSARDRAREQFDDTRKKRLDMFMTGFTAITTRLKEMYQMITRGGDAELELVDSLDPFAEGIAFSVRPPKKSWKIISNLSGGEKTLSSLALVFALHHYKPTPLYVMDEIDAALDFKNVSIIANYIRERTRNAQFLIISLRNNMFELADRLVGIYKTNNCTKSVTIDPASFQLAPSSDSPVLSS